MKEANIHSRVILDLRPSGLGQPRNCRVSRVGIDYGLRDFEMSMGGTGKVSMLSARKSMGRIMTLYCTQEPIRTPLDLGTQMPTLYKTLDRSHSEIELV